MLTGRRWRREIHDRFHGVLRATAVGVSPPLTHTRRRVRTLNPLGAIPRPGSPVPVGLLAQQIHQGVYGAYAILWHVVT